MVRRVSLRVLGSCLPLLVVASGCIHSDLEEVQPARADAEAAASEQTEIGRTVTTAEGNEVTVLRAEEGDGVGSGLVLHEAEVEICAAADGDGAPTAPGFFRAVIRDVGYRRPSPTVRSPALPSSRLAPGECERGWIGFPVRATEDVVGIALLASTTVEWSLD